VFDSVQTAFSDGLNHTGHEQRKIMITPQQAIERLISNNELFYDEMTDLMRQIMSGQVPPEQIAAILTGLRIKVETVSEITAAASVMREFATKVPLENADDLVDIVGTGGDGAKTFNISTTSMFVAAAAGAKGAKHGGRSVSSSSGAADVMEQMGANLNLNPEQVAQSIQQTGIGFDGNRYACAVLFGDSGLSVLQAQACQCVRIYTRGRRGGMTGFLQRCGTAHDRISVINTDAADTDEAV